MTTPLYLDDTYLFNSEAFILQKGEDDKGYYVIFDQTVFYPQGGGQPSDQGFLKNNLFETNITFVRQIEGEIRHYTPLPSSEIPLNLKVFCKVNPGRRILNSRYHTLAHLLGNVIEEAYPDLKAIKGHSFPHEAYVEFQGNMEICSTRIQEKIEEIIERNERIENFDIMPDMFEKQFYKLPYPIPENKKFRAVRIGSMLPIPCGGTHLGSTKEIGNFTLSKIKFKNSTVRLSYGVI